MNRLKPPTSECKACMGTGWVRETVAFSYMPGWMTSEPKWCRKGDAGARRCAWCLDTRRSGEATLDLPAGQDVPKDGLEAEG